MLRYLDARRVFAHLWVGAALACGSAAPIDVGTDITPIEPAGDGPEDESADEPIGQMDTGSPVGVEGLVNSSWDRGEASPYCARSFRACGGVLAGTWEVEDNCNPEIRTRSVLATWGVNTMQLNPTACYTAVQRLAWLWSGEFRFEGATDPQRRVGIAIDDRRRRQDVDVELTADCLNSIGMNEGDTVSPESCEGMENAFTTCALAGGVCMCTNRTESNGLASGYYRVLGVSVEIAQAPATWYEYCVDGDHMLWQEKEGAQRQVVLRRTVNPPPGTKDPLELPK
jgi:hypothetical protein